VPRLGGVMNRGRSASRAERLLGGIEPDAKSRLAMLPCWNLILAPIQLLPFRVY
jgi:hypothetical protein